MQRRPLFAAALAALLLRLWGLGLWEHRPELSGPTTSYKRLLEGIFFWNNSRDPYASQVYKQHAFLILLGALFGPWGTRIALAILDVSTGIFLDASFGSVSSLLYFFNPLAIASCFASSTSALHNALIILTSLFAMKESLGLCALAAALAASNEISCLVMMFAWSVSFKSWKKKGAFFLVVPGIMLVIDLCAVHLLGLRSAVHLWLDSFRLQELAPGLSAYWYLFTLVNPRFKWYFQVVLPFPAVCLLPGLHARFRSVPKFLTFVCLLLLALYKPYPVINDYVIAFVCLPASKDLLSKVRNHFLILVTICVSCSSLSLYMFDLWMTSEAGNANFYYFQLIVIQLSIVLFLVEAITSARIVLDSHKKKRP